MTLASSARTRDAFHLPPRAVGTPRRVNSRAMEVKPMIPLTRIASIISMTLAACASAFALPASAPGFELPRAPCVGFAFIGSTACLRMGVAERPENIVAENVPELAGTGED